MKLRTPLVIILSYFILPTLTHAKEPCWFKTTHHNEVHYGGTIVKNAFCPLTENSGISKFSIGRVIEEDGRIECYSDQVTGSHYVTEFSWLNASYADLAKWLNSNGTYHELFDRFKSRFKVCDDINGGHSYLETTETPQQQNHPYEICLKLKQNKADQKVIAIGTWLNGRCETSDNSPFYVKNAEPHNNYNWKRPLRCDGYDQAGEAWAQTCTPGVKVCFGSWNCKKRLSPEECCKYAHSNKCETVSRDHKGKCCCGDNLDYTDHDRHRNSAIRRKP